MQLQDWTNITLIFETLFIPYTSHWRYITSKKGKGHQLLNVPENMTLVRRENETNCLKNETVETTLKMQILLI